MAGLLSIGLTGLNASQANLQTTSHNITNAATPGYSRQTVSLTTHDPQFSGAGFFGQGVRLDNVKRQYDQFLNQQVLTASARKEEYSAYGSMISQVDNLLADESAGLSPALADFFRGVNDVANNPSSVPARQSLISLAQSLAGRFNSMDARLNEIRDLNEGQIASSVKEINSYASQIAALNQRIGEVEAAGPTVAANDLHDQRDQLVAELNKVVKVSTYKEANGALSVFVGSGQSLVTGNTASQLEVAYPNPADPFRGEVRLVTPGGAVSLPDSVLTGGKLGGYLAFRSETLDRVQDDLGAIAKSVSANFNAIHGGGTDLDGNVGGNFFADIGAASNRQAASLFSVNVSDPRAIAAAQGGSAGDTRPGDNRNALALAGLQTSKVMNGGTATLQSAYSQVLSFAGNKAREVQIGEKAQEAQLQQATTAQQALSGVNLDEEAANLLRFQQSYQAAARVMALAGTLFQEVLSIAR